MNLLFVIVFDWNLFGAGAAALLFQGIESAAYLIVFSQRRDELGLKLRELLFFKGTDTAFIQD